MRAARRSGAPVDVASATGTARSSAAPPAPALRLGLRLVKSLSQAGGARLIVARSVQPFASVPVSRRAQRLIAPTSKHSPAAGAFASLSGDRHFAFWEVAGPERALPLAPARRARRKNLEEGRPLLAAPTEGRGSPPITFPWG